MNVNKTPIVHPYDPDTYGDGAFDPIDDAPDRLIPHPAKGRASKVGHVGRHTSHVHTFP